MLPRFTESQFILRDSVNAACGDLMRQGTTPRSPLSKAWKLFGDMGWTAVALPESVGGLGGGLIDAGIIAKEMGRAILINHYPETIALGRAIADAAGIDPSQEIKDLLGAVADGGSALLRLHPPEAPTPGIYGFLPPCGPARGYIVELIDGSLYSFPLESLKTRPLSTTRRSDDRALLEPLAHDRGVRLISGPAAESAWDTAKGIRKTLAASMLMGAAHSAHRIAYEYAGVRAQFGHLINNYQVVQHSLVDVFATIEAGDLMVLAALGDLEKGAGARAATVTTATAFAREQVWVAMIKTYDIMGGVGYMEDHPLSELTRSLLPVLVSLGTVETCLDEAAAAISREAWL